MLHRKCFMALGFSGLLCLTGCMTERLVNPGSVRISCKSEEQMRKGIKEGLKKRAWALAKEEPGRIYATVFVRSTRADIAIDYDKAQFTIRYLDSENLDHHQSLFGKEMIHENYNRWIRYLMQDISVAVSHAEG